MTGQRYAFLDGLKCVGMTLIVYGHVAGWAPLADFAPIRLKQIGVALFLFALGYSLARDSRSGAEVVFKRLFELYLFGLAVALIVSVTGVVLGVGWGKSNYLPFAGGVNVLFDFFPANPTTWYIGTYLHLVLAGVFLVRRTRVTLLTLIAAFAIEVMIRTVIMDRVASMVAYMAATNWLTVFLLGSYYGQRQQARIDTKWWIPAAALAAFCAGWGLLAKRFPLGTDFPFMLPTGNGLLALVLCSTAISAIYVLFTVLIFATVSNVRRSTTVEFIARNTLLIFLAHMPVYYALLPLMPVDVFGRALRSAILMGLCMFGIAAASEAVHRAVNVKALRDRAFEWFMRFGGLNQPTVAAAPRL